MDAVFQNCTLVERLWSVHRVRACGSYRGSIVPGLREVVVKQIVTFKDNTISSVGIVGDTASAVRHFNCTGTDTQGQCDSESPHLTPALDNTHYWTQQ